MKTGTETDGLVCLAMNPSALHINELSSYAGDPNRPRTGLWRVTTGPCDSPAARYRCAIRPPSREKTP